MSLVIPETCVFQCRSLVIPETFIFQCRYLVIPEMFIFHCRSLVIPETFIVQCGYLVIPETCIFQCRYLVIPETFVIFTPNMSNPVPLHRDLWRLCSRQPFETIVSIYTGSRLLQMSCLWERGVKQHLYMPRCVTDCKTSSQLCKPRIDLTICEVLSWFTVFSIHLSIWAISRENQHYGLYVKCRPWYA